MADNEKGQLMCSDADGVQCSYEVTLRAEVETVRGRLEEMRLQRNQELKRAQDARSERDEARGACRLALSCLDHFLPGPTLAEVNAGTCSDEHYNEGVAVESVKQALRNVLPTPTTAPAATPQQSGEGDPGVTIGEQTK